MPTTPWFSTALAENAEMTREVTCMHTDAEPFYPMILQHHAAAHVTLIPLFSCGKR
ncbi:hypothetical protein [Schaalia sp. lx-260]|uniref:hypothetical protein n=1 Tax=Schaalia sp. lx-260 TaxID=2899082 RepID=UPI001E4231AA|nr:hypothetical protein [Schaalia sp. lx-260]MCD4549318.1 hypothetical protein [Schaalia sp. lx-260]